MLIRISKNNFGKFNYITSVRCYSSQKAPTINLFGKEYPTDDWTNINKSIQDKLERNLIHQKYHPLNHLVNKIKHFFYKNYINRNGNPLFSVYDNFRPIVSVEENFDSLLTPKDHVSRSKKDCFYVNKDYLLRAHTTAHDNELIRSGLNCFLTFGDVYRRDEIDAKHYPIFHQCDGVRLFDKNELFRNAANEMDIFEKDPSNLKRTSEKQKNYTLDACKIVEYDLKNTLTNLVQFIFGTSSKINMKWVDATFPFTHPSWELEIEYKGNWYEVLGCGILEQEILTNAGAENHIAWAFGLGLERWAMILYDISDIRVFWSTDNGFLSQFKFDDPTHTKIIKYKPVSVYPPCPIDISFWLPEPSETFTYNSNDFYDLVRDVGGDLVEQVTLIDNFENKKTKKTSHCYRIVYRSMDKTLSLAEVNQLHKLIQTKAAEQLGVKIR
ncbi:unnamed protein product [Brachionus calyciflorus]|uniref:Phenylalanine--tRNA ligase, mitochondrial n=1 Tax=Brachionus calyciflorus TaxID=104777 RepID=A0A813VE18_9BILA|nr:unnamed protein product [Brachionus calyciflorus]